MASNWSREEVEATVADYFSMLELELKGISYDKTKHRRNLLRILKNRSEGSIEFKHQNISAVLIELKFPYIPGYKPRSNFQGMLREIISERLNVSHNLIAIAKTDVERAASVPEVGDILKTLTDPPKVTASRNQIRERTPSYHPKGIDYLEREANNRSLGLAGEKFVFNYERAWLISKGKEALASKIDHVSETQGDGLGFDILSFEASGKEKLIEVKTTKYGKETPFYISRNELTISQSRAKQYHLYRLFSFRKNPGLFTLGGALSSTCLLDPETYIATVA